MSASRSCRSASFSRRFGRVDVGAQVLRVLQRRLVAACFDRSVASASSSACFGTSWRLFSSAARSYACFACTSSAAAFCTSGVCSIGGRWLGVRRAVLRQRAIERRLLLLELVLQLLAVELDQHLAGLHPIAEIREHPADAAVGLRRNRHLVDGGERADDFDRAVQRFLPDRFDLHRLRARRARAPAPYRISSSRRARGRRTQSPPRAGKN